MSEVPDPNPNSCPGTRPMPSRGRIRIGIDLGGTKIAAMAMAADGRELQRLRVPTPAGDYPGTLAAITGLVERLEHTFGQAAGIGVGTPGSLSPATGLIRNANSTVLNGQALDRDLIRSLAARAPTGVAGSGAGGGVKTSGAAIRTRLRLANDADCFALSEATDGAAAGAGVVFGVIAGTGTGAGVVVRGQLLAGANGIAGEWGHNPLPWPEDGERPGPACYCGRSGCIETWLSGPGMAADHLAHGGQASVDPCLGAPLDAEAVCLAAQAGDVRAEQTLLRYERRMARALASVINVLDPDVIVLGGGMSNIARLYQSVPALWGQWIFSDTVTTRLVPPRFGDDSGLRGAAWLAD